MTVLDETFADDEAMEPPKIQAPADHPLWPAVKAKLKTVYDPEIPVNIYELGLIYSVEFNATNDVKLRMSLTAPGCPVAGEMPGMVQGAVRGIDEVGEIDVELVWEPSWDPSRMADTARLQLNMY